MPNWYVKVPVLTVSLQFSSLSDSVQDAFITECACVTAGAIFGAKSSCAGGVEPLDGGDGQRSCGPRLLCKTCFFNREHDTTQ